MLNSIISAFSFITTTMSFLGSGDGISTNKGILSLDSSNFDHVISNNEFVLIKFYAPWCIHCKALRGEFEKAAQILATRNADVIMAQVDVTVEKQLAMQNEIIGYPTIKFFKYGNGFDYTGGRSADEIVTWVLTKIRSSRE
ncbi:Thioredoxin domain containing protein [Asbolus verrucosus]|uniref:Thioredoxin domain containing protein n=1 Tax=Asbolus verrucosus TaxID=1661398 RepID=A0A482W2F5_ASBVE|nr:Thioredoxin domain containing protein [Asbolus verrucosus]